jgi:hypothetical protein
MHLNSIHLQIKSLFLLIIIAFVGCETASGPGTTDFKEELMKEPAHNFEYYKSFFDPQSKLADRIRSSDGFVLEYLEEYDGVDNYEFYQPTDQEKDLLEEYLELLPEGYLEVLQSRITGIYFVENYVASGMTDYVLCKDSDDIYCILIFNPDLINVPMEEWITKKENTCFIDTDPNLNIRINIESSYTGLLYILIHETTHVMDYVLSITPYTEPDIGKLNGTLENTSDFTDGIWDNYRTPTAVNNYELRDLVTFYGFKGGPLIADTSAVDIYTNLGKSSFVSLYGSTNWAEDLAEYMTYYHLTQNLGLDYSINVTYHKAMKFSYQPFEKSDVVSRRSFIDKL